MLWTMSIVCFCLWLLAVLTPATFHGYVHVLLSFAVAALLLRVFGKRSAID